jgi:HlyD family secretion protein
MDAEMTDSDHSTSLRKPDSKTKAAAGTEAFAKPASGKKPPKAAIIRIILLLLVVGGIIAFQMWRNRPEGKPGWLRVNGRIEGYEVNVGAKIAGRVEMISDREGAVVEKGKLLVKLSDDDIQAQLRGARARVLESEQAVHEAEELVEVSKHQVEQARISVIQSREDAEGRIREAEANVATAHANLSQALAQQVQATADLDLARIRKKRYGDLVVKGAVTQDESDQADSTFESMKATVLARNDAVSASREQLHSAESALQQARSNALNPPLRISQHAAIQGQCPKI